MFRKLFNTKVRVEALEKHLSDSNLWISEYKPWKEVWASITIKDISARRTLYLFALKWTVDFPREFRVVLKDKIFLPTQFPVVEPANDLVLFHATLS
ncbi:MAG: hypothetical protein LBB63_00560 [Holosporaceae bacterium]|jgi:hypothetical protein|nr:hypothetical protein [Holosporaceae bacterium]